MLRQRTVAGPAGIRGIGLHSGEDVRMVLRPAPEDTGVVFRRVDLDPVLAIPARSENVGATRLSTSLHGAGQHVATVEHLLAALFGLGVDNAYVDISAAELPIMDGSAAPFVQLVRGAGVVELEAPRRFVRIVREVWVEEGDKYAGFIPFDGFKIAFTIDFDRPVVREQVAHVELDFSAISFIDELSAARTFGFVEQVEALRAGGMARGGSFDNAVVVDEHRVLNRGGLRSPDEFVKHKVLDAMGDLYLMGCGMLGEFRAYKSGHTLNNAAVRALLARPDAWELVTWDDPSRTPFLREW